MAIRHKRKTTTGYTWDAADLVDGQLGLNTADGTIHLKKTDTSVVTIGGATTPAGSNTEIQFNNSGAFGASSNLTWNGSALGVTGNLTLSGNSRLIQGDWSNSTVTNRTFFQSNVTNGATSLMAMPNGTSQVVNLVLENSSTVGNNAYSICGISNTRGLVGCATRGSGTALPFYLVAGTGASVSIGIDVNANVMLGGHLSTALSTSATNGFAFINSVAGTPSGTPAGFVGATGKTPLTIDTTNNRLYFYSGSSWKSPLQSAAPDYETAVATAAQTVFNTTLATTANASGKAYLQVFVNGLKQIEGAGKAYTVTGANQITFNAGLALNADVEFYAFV